MDVQKISNNYGVPYLFYHECKGIIDHNIASILGNGYPNNEVTAQTPHNMDDIFELLILC